MITTLMSCPNKDCGPKNTCPINVNFIAGPPSLSQRAMAIGTSALAVKRSNHSAIDIIHVLPGLARVKSKAGAAVSWFSHESSQ
jgi:hypothetical protein